MSNNEIITLQFGHYSNFIGAHWWNIQENSFVYDANQISELNHDVLFREGLNYKKEVTFTPRLLLVDLKGSLGTLLQYNDLYDDTRIPEVTEDSVLWDVNNTQVEQAPKCDKNEFLNDIENQEEQIDDETCPFSNLIRKYELDDKVLRWSDYLATRFHPRTITTINDYEHEDAQYSFSTFYQGLEMWNRELFSDEWVDKCRIYAEECNSLQGFQLLFDCVDGFAGLSCSALAYLQDEYASKGNMCFPCSASWYPENPLFDSSARIINSVLTFGELTELSSAFLPLCTGVNGWNESDSPREFPFICYNEKLPYHSSAVLASYLDTISVMYRRRNNAVRLSNFTSKLTPCGRNLLAGTMTLPFPVYPDQSIMESFEKLENPFWTSVTPSTNVTVDTSALNELTVRGLSSFSLLPSLEKRATNPTYQCKTIEEMIEMYLNYCSSVNKAITNINSLTLPLKIPSSFPHIFDSNVTRIGCIASTNFPVKFRVKEAPMFAGIHNCSSVSSLLTYLCDSASKINLRQLHQFSTSGMEYLEYSESIEKLLTLNDSYK